MLNLDMHNCFCLFSEVLPDIQLQEHLFKYNL